jgi:hypothetical protein
MTIQEKIDEAKALGWEVFDRSYVHPHSNSYEEMFSYKSPRMKHVGFLHRDIDLKDAEAKCVATDFIAYAKMNMDTKAVMEKLQTFFRENPTEGSDTTEVFFALVDKFISTPQ